MTKVPCWNYFFFLRHPRPVVALEVLDVMIWALIKAALCLDEEISPHHCHFFLSNRFSSLQALYFIVLPCASENNENLVKEEFVCMETPKVKYFIISLWWLLDCPAGLFFSPNLTKDGNEADPKIHSCHFPTRVGFPRDTLVITHLINHPLCFQRSDLSAALSSNDHSGKDFGRSPPHQSMILLIIIIFPLRKKIISTSEEKSVTYGQNFSDVFLRTSILDENNTAYHHLATEMTWMKSYIKDDIRGLDNT